MLGGFLSLIALAALKRAPAEAPVEEAAIRVDGFAVEAGNFPVLLTGYGAAHPLRTIGISAEVSGLVTNVHPSLRVGQVIPAGDLLFQVDDRDYQSAVSEAEAAVEQSRQSVARYEEEGARTENRLKTSRRNRELAAQEYERVRGLLEEHQVGNQAELDLAEKALNTAIDLADEMEKNLAITPLLIQEAEAVLKAAEARLARARLKLERCDVRASARARVFRTAIEEGQFVHAGTEVVALADDSVLEIRVPLDAREAYQWLKLDDAESPETGAAWFSNVTPTACTVRWTEAPETHRWTGVLHRIEQLSVATRTLTVVVRVSGEEASQGDGFPLVEGMFCSVEIPGRMLEGVFRVPRWSVGVDQSVYLAVDGRLVTRPVRVAYTYEDFALIDQGLEEGDILVATRLVDPLERSRLDLVVVPAEEVIP